MHEHEHIDAMQHSRSLSLTSIGVQTDCRESEVQTDPFTPQVKLQLLLSLTEWKSKTFRQSFQLPAQTPPCWRWALCSMEGDEYVSHGLNHHQISQRPPYWDRLRCGKSADARKASGCCVWPTRDFLKVNFCWNFVSAKRGKAARAGGKRTEGGVGTDT